MKAQLKQRANLENREELQNVIPLDVPYVLFVDPASACNFQCTFCPTGHRNLIDKTGRFQGVMKWDIYKKIIDDLNGFDKNIRVLRLYKDGEPFLNKKLPDMIAYAKKSGCVDYIDTTTNGSLLTPETMAPVIEAGLDKINVSVDGMNNEQYMNFTKFDFDFPAFLENIKWLYANKGTCEIVIKIPGDLITQDQQKEFFDLFGNYCDRIFIENFAPCWPEFDVEAHTGVEIKTGLYGQEIRPTETCPYIFYGMSINSDGLSSACFLDWQRQLIIGDVRTQNLKEIWNGDKFNELRLLHLQGKRCSNQVCASCGQLSHCLPDNFDEHREVVLQNFKKYLSENSGHSK